jgi:hypothetical protein
MRTRFNSSRVLTILALSLTAFLLMSANGEAGAPGLDRDAGQELRDAGVDKRPKPVRNLPSETFPGKRCVRNLPSVRNLPRPKPSPSETFPGTI